MQKKVMSLTAAAALLSVSTLAQAEFYLTGGMQLSNYGYSDVDNSTGYTLGAGYRFNENWFVDLRYFDGGDADIEDDGTLANAVPGATLSDFQLSVSGFAAAVGYMVPVGARSGMFGRVGVYKADSEMSWKGQLVGGVGPVVAFSMEDDATQLTWGLGFDWMFTQGFGLRGAIDGLFKPKDFVDDETITQFSLGLIGRFGGSSQ